MSKKIDAKLVGTVALGGGLGVIGTDMVSEWLFDDVDDRLSWWSPAVAAGLGVLAIVVVGKQVGSYAFAGAAVGSAVAQAVDIVRGW